MYRRFVFEGEEMHVTLSCVPLAVRRKLDLAGLKISLAGWQTLPRAERLALCHLPVDEGDDLAIYREVFQTFAARAGVALTPLVGGPADPASFLPAAVREALQARLPDAEAPSEVRLIALDVEERYALAKLADPKRDVEKLREAMRELGLGSG